MNFHFWGWKEVSIRDTGEFELKKRVAFERQTFILDSRWISKQVPLLYSKKAYLAIGYLGNHNTQVKNVVVEVYTPAPSIQGENPLTCSLCKNVHDIPLNPANNAKLAQFTDDIVIWATSSSPKINQ